ncbi:MAG: pyridoxal phosphate-dependent aminotransferase [Gammaproteobacteria bacterium]
MSRVFVKEPEGVEDTGPLPERPHAPGPSDVTPRGSRRMHAVQEPVIPLVADLIRAHPGTISLGQGVAFYGPPPAAIARIQDFAADPDNHKYGPVHGIPGLLSLIEAKLARENLITTGITTGITAGAAAGAGYGVIVTAGANMGFVNAICAITDPGDEIILPLPYYFNQEMAIRMLDCTPVVVETDQRFQPRPDLIEHAITEKTRAVVTISPNNPSGAVYPEPTLRAINALCRARGLYHINDEAYEDFTYGAARHFSPGCITGACDHTLSLFSLSKAYGFASWRIGYMVVPEHLYPAILKIQDTNLICAPVISQHAAVGALEIGAAYCRERLPAIDRVRRTVLDGLTTLGSRCEAGPAEGALYVFARIDTALSAMDLVRRLIADHGVAVIPGHTFGMNRGCYIRVSFGALDRDTADEGVRRLVRGLRALA